MPSVRGRFRYLAAYIEATLPQRRFHPVDLGLRSAVATLRRTDIQPPASRGQYVHVGAAQRLHPMMLSGQAGPGFGVLKLRAQPAQVGLEPLGRLGGQGLVPGPAAGLAQPPGCTPRADERAYRERGQRDGDEEQGNRAHLSSVGPGAAESKCARAGLRPSMPAALVITVLVVQVLGSTVGLVGKPVCVEAGPASEAVDRRKKQDRYDDVHPPHVDHHFSVTILACPAGRGSNH